MLRKDIKAFPYKLQTVHKLEAEDNYRRVEMCKTLLNHYENNSFNFDNSVIKLFFICLEE